MWSSVTAAGTENGPAPPSRSKHSATLLAGHVYLLGGRNGNLPLKDLWRYSLGKSYSFCLFFASTIHVKIFNHVQNSDSLKKIFSNIRVLLGDICC